MRAESIGPVPVNYFHKKLLHRCLSLKYVLKKTNAEICRNFRMNWRESTTTNIILKPFYTIFILNNYMRVVNAAAQVVWDNVNFKEFCKIMEVSQGFP